MSFYGLEIAKTGLFTSSRALNVTGNNIANVNTDGYTRQRLTVSSIEAHVMNSRFGTSEHGTVGGGVDVQSLDQIRDKYLDGEFRREYTSLQQWSKRTDTLGYIESLLNESSNNSISKTVADFFDSISEFSKDTVTKEIRTNVQQNALKVTETFNHYYDQLTELQKLQNDNMKVAVDRINEISQSIADYNKQIFSYELSGEKANELRDKRNSLLDELSGIVNMDYSEDDQGRLSVKVGDAEVVNHLTVTKLIASPDTTGVVTGEPGFCTVRVDTTGTPALNYSGGELASYRKLRDGNSVDDIGIPRIIDNLNTLARSLAKEFNAIHNTAYTIPYTNSSGTSISSHNAVNFFDSQSGDYSKVTAKNFSLSAEVKESVWNIAGSDKLIDLSATNDQRGNNIKALEMLALTSSDSVPGVTNFENFLKSTIVEVALDSSYSQKMYDSSKSVVTNLENRKEAISGVSLDEEVVQMMKYQHAYTAASRVITAIDEMLDVLINRTGSVGR